MSYGPGIEFWFLNLWSGFEMDISNLLIAIATFCVAGASLTISTSNIREFRRSQQRQVGSEITQRWCSDVRAHAAAFLASGSMLSREQNRPETDPPRLSSIVYTFEEKSWALLMLLDPHFPVEKRAFDAIMQYTAASIGRKLSPDDEAALRTELISSIKTATETKLQFLQN